MRKIFTVSVILISTGFSAIAGELTWKENADKSITHEQTGIIMPYSINDSKLVSWDAGTNPYQKNVYSAYYSNDEETFKSTVIIFANNEEQNASSGKELVNVMIGIEKAKTGDMKLIQENELPAPPFGIDGKSGARWLGTPEYGKYMYAVIDRKHTVYISSVHSYKLTPEYTADQSMSIVEAINWEIVNVPTIPAKAQ